jgi:hypothetical protein
MQNSQLCVALIKSTGGEKNETQVVFAFEQPGTFQPAHLSLWQSCRN